MKKVFYNNWLAKTILMKDFGTITLAAWVLTIHSKNEINQSVINHECVHAKQWIECAVVTAIIVWLLMAVFDISCWWMLLSLIAFYVQYGLEYLIKRWNNTADEAYEKISFEREARLAENDNSYLENSGYFEWLKLI
ncbi:hypothetical protein [uncultured Bacteroides sp.]|uniref:hypothetical protein n=1 Tax=uncultured Bacteroides sp. TaxID=162156 RepID=UPI002592FA21|nr:hypothetical protein [uncultured Bacteroides sp.]